MSAPEVQSLVEDATLDFTLGDVPSALEKLDRAIQLDPDSFSAWHALAEVRFSERNLDRALAAAERAHALQPDDIHINTSLSRIWMERGDKKEAERFGANARMLSWKEELREPKTDSD